MSLLKFFSHDCGFSEAMGLITVPEGVMLKLTIFGLRLRELILISDNMENWEFYVTLG